MTQLKYFKIIYFFVLVVYLAFNYVSFQGWLTPSIAQDIQVKGISNEPFKIDEGEIVDEGVRKIGNIKYVNDSAESKKLDLYLPSKMYKDQKYPILLYIHGGAWLEGNKSYFRDYDFVRHGYIVASIDYRLSTEDLFPAQIHDSKAALRWLKANSSKYNIDAENVGAYGESAGGHLAALMGTTEDDKELNGDIGTNLDENVKVKAVVNEYGLPNFESIAQQCEKNDKCTNDYKDEGSIISKLLGCNYGSCGKKLKDASPINYISENDAAFLHFHGGNDSIVPTEQASEFHKALIKANLYSEIAIEKDARHVDSNYRKEYSHEMLNFFDLKLKKYKYPFCEVDPTKEVIFDDVPKKSNYFTAVNNLACKNAFYNMRTKNFEPAKKITRSEIASMLNITFDIQIKTECEPFDDVDEMNRNFNFIQNLKCESISKGFNNNEFKPDEEINATQLANLISKIQKKGLDEVNGKIKSLELENPDDSLSRAQASQIINLFI